MSHGGKRRPRTGTGKDIDHVLLALTYDDLEWSADPDRLFSWMAQCPFCRQTIAHPPKTLRLNIDNDEWLGDDDYVKSGSLTMGCSNRCRPPDEIRAYLMRDPTIIRHERRLTVAHARLRWWIYKYRVLDRKKAQRPS